MSNGPPRKPTIRSYRPGEERAVVDLLNASYPERWGDVDSWRAKHLDRSGFEPRHVFLAEIDGRLVGCLHCAVIPMRLGPDTIVPVSVDGDLAVHPEVRGCGVPERLYAVSDESLRADGVVMRVGYSGTEARLAFYTRVLGYVAGFEDIRAHRKVIDPSFLRDRLLARFGAPAHVPDPGHGALVEIVMTGLPAFRVRLAQSGLVVSSDQTTRPALRIEADQRVLDLFAAEHAGVRRTLTLFWRRAVRIRPSPAGVVRVSLWVLTQFIRRRP